MSKIPIATIGPASLTIKNIDGYRFMTEETALFHTDIKGIEFFFPLITLWFDGSLFVHPGYAWDGASGPFTIQTKTNKIPSLAHDALYQAMREGLLPRTYREQVDKLFWDLCLEYGMVKFRAWYFYKGVRAFGKNSSLPRKNPRGVVKKITRTAKGIVEVTVNPNLGE